MSEHKPTQPYVIGFDVGGTRLKFGAVTRDGQLLQESAPATINEGPLPLLDALENGVQRIRDALAQPPLGVAIGLSGAVDPKQGIVLLPGKLRGLQGFPLVPELQKRIGVPVIAENDGRLSIIAEKAYGLARDKQWALTITIGTGLGSGVMIDGKILRSPSLQFGNQVGHMVIQSLGGRLCLTGARGTGEMTCSATALIMQVRDGLQRGIESILTERYLADPRTIDFAAVIEGVQQGDRLCINELEHWRLNLGWLLVSAVHAYAPEIIILSGGALKAADYFLPALRQQVNSHIFRYPVGEEVPMVVSQMGEYAGVLGAAAVAWEMVQNS